VKLRRYLLCGCVVARHGMACVLHAVHATQTPLLSPKPATCPVHLILLDFITQTKLG